MTFVEFSIVGIVRRAVVIAAIARGAIFALQHPCISIGQHDRYRATGIKRIAFDVGMVKATGQAAENEFDVMRTVRTFQKQYSITPVTVAILTVYFVQGVLGLSRLAVTFYLKDELHLSPAESGALLGFSSLPLRQQLVT